MTATKHTCPALLAAWTVWLTLMLALTLAKPAYAEAPLATPAEATPTAAPMARLVVQTDADDLVIELRGETSEGRLVGLKKGDNDLEVPAGPLRAAITAKGGRAVAMVDVQLAASERKTVKVASRGALVVQAPADAHVQVDGKDLSAQNGVFTGDFEPGARSVVVQRIGSLGQKGNVTVQVSKTATVTPELDRFDPGGRTTMAWASIVAGGALVVAALVVDATVKWDDYGGDGARWGAFSLGAAGFIGGTVLLKRTLDEPAPVEERPFKVQVSHAPGGAVARVGWAF